VRYFYIFCFVLLGINVQSSAQVSASFTMDKTGSCSPLVVSFTNTTYGASANATYLWDLGNGNTSTAVNAAGIYTSVQTYAVKLTVTDGGQTSVSTQQVTVYPLPAIDFSITSSKVCMPNAASFTATATVNDGGISSYLWDMGNGVTQQSYGSSFQYNYFDTGKYTVSVTATSDHGCSRTVSKPDIVQIFPALSVYFSADKTILCKVNDPVQLTNNSSGPGALTYVWNFGDGTTSTQTNPVHSFNTKGIYTVTLTATSPQGCVLSQTQSDYLNVASYKSDFSVPAPICQNASAYFNFTGSPQPTYNEWFINDQSQGYSYYYQNFYTGFTNAGTYKMKQVSTFGTCVDSVTKTITVQKNPILNGFITDVPGKCGAPAKINLTDTTSDAISWNWNYYAPNDGWSSSTGKSTSINATTNGFYSINLTVQNAAGCSAAVQQSVTIASPSAGIGYNGNTNVCGPFQLDFYSNFSSPLPDSIVSYNWAFGDGFTSTKNKFSRTFNKPGVYTVNLNYTTKNGCTGSASAVVYENERPHVDFAGTQTLCGNTSGNLNVSFYGSANGYTPTYSWIFSDGSSGYGSNISHNYAQEGKYTVTLNANFGACGDTTITKTDYVTVLPPFPALNAGVNTCDGTRGDVAFTQASVHATTVNWNFGDGTNIVTTPGSQTNISHTYKATGVYNVTLTANNGTCSLPVSTTVYVLLKQKPVLASTQTAVCADASLPVAGSNFETNPYWANWYSSYAIAFQYSDGTPYQGSFNINYTNGNWYWNNQFTGLLTGFAAGEEDIRIISTSNGFGCNDTSNYIPLTILGAKAKFSVDNNNTCFKNALVFHDQSTTVGGNKILQWQWNFGDGYSQLNTSNASVSHVYANPGNYAAQLMIVDAGGCTTYSSYSSNINLDGPKAGFYLSDPNPTITEQIYYYNSSNTYGTTNTDYRWSLGDGTTSTDAYPTHAYATPGNYNIRLIARDGSCIDTAYQTITVKNFLPAFVHNVQNISSTGCPPLLVSFTNISYNYNTVSWDFGDGITAGNTSYPSHVYKSPGKYIVTMYVYGPGGVSGIYKDSVTINIPAASFVFNPLKACIGQNINFKGTGTDVSQYTWDYGDGTVANSNVVSSHIYNTAGIYNPALMASDSAGCVAAFHTADKVTINPNPTISFKPAQPQLCKGTELQLTASGALTYSWAPTFGLSNAAIANPMVLVDTSTTFIVTGQDAQGCTGKANILVKVIDPFVMTVSKDTTICAGSKAQLFAQNANSYEWIKDITALNNTQISNPVAMPGITTTYTVVGKDQYNCFADTANITVKVIPLPTVTMVSSYKLETGQSQQLTPTYSPDIITWNWTPSTYLSCNNCASPVVTPLSETQYILTVANAGGCLATDTVDIKIDCADNRIYIPGAFTPNNDGVNDFFVVKGADLIKHMVIFNRWGDKVFERYNLYGNDRAGWWDGTVNGLPAEPNTYVYMIELQCPVGGAFYRKGTVVLIR
jgi:gliding motility-associated-like protein